MLVGEGDHVVFRFAQNVRSGFAMSFAQGSVHEVSLNEGASGLAIPGLVGGHDPLWATSPALDGGLATGSALSRAVLALSTRGMIGRGGSARWERPFLTLPTPRRQPQIPAPSRQGNPRSTSQADPELGGGYGGSSNWSELDGDDEEGEEDDDEPGPPGEDSDDEDRLDALCRGRGRDGPPES